MDAVSAVLVAARRRGRAPEVGARLVGGRARGAHGAAGRGAGGLAGRAPGGRARGGDADQPRRRGGPTRRRPGHAGWASGAAGAPVEAKKTIEPVRAARGQGAGDGRADEDRAEEAGGHGQGRGQGSAEPDADQGREGAARERRGADRRPRAGLRAVDGRRRHGRVPRRGELLLPRLPGDDDRSDQRATGTRSRARRARR